MNVQLRPLLAGILGWRLVLCPGSNSIDLVRETRLGPCFQNAYLGFTTCRVLLSAQLSAELK